MILGMRMNIGEVLVRMAILMALGVLCLLQSCTVLEPSRQNPKAKEIILTIDDGPVAGVSDKMLDMLERQEVKAVFCYVGDNIKLHPQIATRALNEGHQLVNHSMHHNAKTLATYETYLRETEEVEKLIDSLPTQNSHDLTYIRPPFGIITPSVQRVAKEKGLKFAFVNSYTHEAPSDGSDKDKILEFYQNRVLKHGGGAIVFHEMRYRDGDPTMTDKTWLPSAVEEFIIWAKAEGFTFVTYQE